MPNCDFFVHLDLPEIQEDIVVSGNVIGEYGLFSKDPYEYSVTCITGVQVYLCFFSTEIIFKFSVLIFVVNYTIDK